MKPRRIQPAAGQESVWDYPRPPRLEAVEKPVRIIFNDMTLASTSRAWRVLETSHPPVYYLPPEGLAGEFLHRTERSSFCEWKGHASYVTVRAGQREARNAGWFYADPTPPFEPIRDHVAFYAGPMDSCTVDGEVVRPQPGGFYGGWITSDIVGPFKGEPGTMGW